MDSKISALIIAAIVAVALAAAIHPAGQPVAVEYGINTTGQELAKLHVTVVGSSEKDPVDDAVVYLGRYPPEALKCRTGAGGECSIGDIVVGDHGLNAFRKGYSRYHEPVRLEAGDNHVTIGLDKNAETLPSFTVEGVVLEEVFDEGTKSENRFYMIRTDGGKETYIFDETGSNRGFDGFVNKRVTITGFEDTGLIGWQGRETVGICVEDIRPESG